MNTVSVVGNITGDIYFDQFLIKGRQRLYLRLVLMASKPDPVRGLRIILWDQRAALFYPYLRKGSEIAVEGKLTSRTYKDNLLHEVMARHLVILRRAKQRGLAELGAAYSVQSVGEHAEQRPIQGLVLPDIKLASSVADEAGQNGPRAELSFGVQVANSQPRPAASNGHVKVLVKDRLAELAANYIQAGDQVALLGRPLTDQALEADPPAALIADELIYIDRPAVGSGDVTSA